ncbi:hypothetical protein [Pseudomonas sp. FSL W5-0299]|uniref:hypothetical protein n=1 Tax=Pseudomonas sp. FSL W5-0299 TaxID=1917484 RepID=UPI0009CCF398|nr:hypothetical protein [Pseudomonas sp. FSL W5-0299]OOL34020.1 hypothetical protein BOO94_30690 [Pseudomonas sp. FSL W5-0299]
MSEPKVIYLGPACEAETSEGRTWAEDNPWPDCECGHRPVEYVLGETFERMKAERDALQLRLNAADQVIDDLKAQVAPLSAIGELILSQDNRCTDQPLFAVMEKRGVLTLDTHDHDRIEWVETESGDYCEADESKARRLEALHQGHRETPGWERYAIKDIDVFVTACFTEQGCKDFLERDGHNHRRPFIYAFGSYRNGEYQMVRNWLKSLREQAAPAAL